MNLYFVCLLNILQQVVTVGACFANKEREEYYIRLFISHQIKTFVLELKFAHPLSFGLWNFV
jgi:hypothetical protein